MVGSALPRLIFLMEPEQPELIEQQKPVPNHHLAFELCRPSKSPSEDDKERTQGYYNSVGRYQMPMEEEHQFMARLAEANIRRHNNPENNYNHSMYFQIISSREEGKYLTLQVFVASFELAIEVLNRNAHRYPPQQEIGKGTYGKVYTAYDGKRQYAKKFIQLNNDRSHERYGAYDATFKEVLREYCILKIAGILGIAPKVHEGFDLVCYNNGIEFAMELCKPYYCFTGSDLAKSFIELVNKMHWLHIIHKDIKPANLLCSFDGSRLLIGDFGISNIVYESPQQHSMTCYGGTPKYMCEDMKQLKHSSSFWLNLYYNDKECLRNSLDEITVKSQGSDRADYAIKFEQALEAAMVNSQEIRFENQLLREYSEIIQSIQDETQRPRYNQFLIERLLGTSLQLLRYIDYFHITHEEKLALKILVEKAVENSRQVLQSAFLKRGLGLTSEFATELSVYLNRRIGHVDVNQFAHMVNMVATLFHSCVKSPDHRRHCHEAIYHLICLQSKADQYCQAHQQVKQAIVRNELELQQLRREISELKESSEPKQSQIDRKEVEYSNIERKRKDRQRIYKNYQKIDVPEIKKWFQELLNLAEYDLKTEVGTLISRQKYKKDPQMLTQIGLVLNSKGQFRQALQVLRQVDPTKFYQEPLNVMSRAMERIEGPQKTLQFLQDVRQQLEKKPDKIFHCQELMLIYQRRIEILAQVEPRSALAEAQHLQDRYGMNGWTNEYEKAMLQLYKFQYKPIVLKCKAKAYRENNFPQAIRAIQQAEQLIAQLHPFKKHMVVIPYKKFRANTLISFGRTRSDFEKGIKVLLQLVQHHQKYSNGFDEKSKRGSQHIIGELHHMIAKGYRKLQQVDSAIHHLNMAEDRLYDSEFLFEVRFDRIRWLWRENRDQALQRLSVLERSNRAGPVQQRTQQIYDLRMEILGVPKVVERMPMQSMESSQLKSHEKRLGENPNERQLVIKINSIFDESCRSPTHSTIHNIRLQIECCRILVNYYTQRTNFDKHAEKNAQRWLWKIRNRLDNHRITVGATMDQLAVNLLKHKCYKLARLCVYQELSDAFRAAQYTDAFLRVQNIASGIFTENEIYSGFLNFTMKMIESGNPRNPLIDPIHYLFRHQKKPSRSINVVRQVHRFHVALNKSHPPAQTANNLKIIELKDMLQFIVNNRTYDTVNIPLRTVLATLKQLKQKKPKMTASINSALITAKKNVRGKAFRMRYNKMVHSTALLN